MVICFEEYVLFRWDLYSVIYGLVVLQRRRTDIRLPRLAVYDVCPYITYVCTLEYD